MKKLKEGCIMVAITLGFVSLVIQTSDASNENIINNIELINDSLKNDYKLPELTEEERAALLSGQHVMRFLSDKRALIFDLSACSK